MAYIVGADRYQTRMVTTSLDDLISKDNSVRVIDSYVESLNLENLGFIEYSVVVGIEDNHLIADLIY
nr:hypothetical protein [Blautia caecimuris]